MGMSGRCSYIHDVSLVGGNITDGDKQEEKLSVDGEPLIKR
jgi:hypothetical protein